MSVDGPPVGGAELVRSCITWRRRPSAKRVVVTMAIALLVAAVVVWIGEYRSHLTTACGSDPNSSPGGTCLRRGPRAMEVGYLTYVNPNPHSLAWSVLAAALIIGAAAAYVLWPRRPSPLAWREFERRVQIARAGLAQTPGSVLSDFDAEYQRIRARSIPRRQP